ncbi:MAG: GDSL-type esterase/lipase family protein [Fuerstiella sp.]
MLSNRFGNHIAKSVRHFICCMIAGVSLILPSSTVLSSTVTADDAVKFVLPETNDNVPGVGPLRRGGWFKKVWNTRRTLFAAESASGDQQNSVVFLGDSITQGWHQDCMKMFPGLNLANRGISGDTTRGMLLRLKDDVLNLKPAAVVMLMGTNDLADDATPQMIAENTVAIMKELLKANPETDIVYCNVMPSNAKLDRPAEKITAINKLVAKAAILIPQVTIVDTYTLFANKEGDAKKEEFPDLLHPNKAGYEKWANAVRPVLATLGYVETEEVSMELEPTAELLFNGKNLTGWGYQPTTTQMKRSRARWQKNNPSAPIWPIIEEAVAFDGQTSASDGRYVAVGGRLVVTTPSEGRRIQQLWTTKEFEGDFTLKLQFRATPNADSGVFVRGPQLQCRDYKLAGPYKDLEGYKEGDWNTLVIEIQGKTARCTCNGEVIEEAFQVPAKGRIGLEGDRGQIEYRALRIVR